LVNTCGALAATLTVSPALGNRLDAAEGQLDLALKDGEHLLESRGGEEVDHRRAGQTGR
jgi:hypothetical protein